MLRAVRWQERTGKFVRAGAFARAMLRPLTVAALMFLLMRAEIMLDCAPFAAAFFAAGLAAGESPAALVAGCLIGMFRLPLKDISLVSAISCAAVLAGEIVFSLSSRLRSCMAETKASLVAGFGVLLPSLVQAGGDALPSLQALACAALAAACAPFFVPALGLHYHRKRLMAQEKIGAVLLLGACLAGMRVLLPPLSRAAALFLILLLPELGATGGVLWGIALAQGGIGLIACLALCGFVGGLKIYTRRWQRSLAVLAAWCLMLLFEKNIGAIEAVSAAAAAAILPSAIADKIQQLASPPEPDCDPERISRDVSAESARRMRSLGDAFGEMADGCAQSADVPDEQELICRMRDRLCSGCAAYADCWTGGDQGAARFLCRLIEDAMAKLDAPAGMRVLYSDGEIPPDILRFCRRGRMIPDRLGLLLRDFAEKRRSEIKRCATGRLLSVQLLQAREILYDLAEKQAKPLYGRKMDALQAALDAAMLEDCRASAFGVDGPEVHLRKEGGWTKIEAQRAREALVHAWGGDFAPELGGNLLRFRQKPRLTAESGAACQSGVAGQPCGDSHLIRNIGGSKLAVMLSDGMGSGSAAAEESAETLRLLWKFLDAGISRPLALETVNQQMLMRTGDDIFATVDLCMLDLNTGAAEFSKLAACRTLILRGQEVLRIEGGRLPLGILEGVQSDVRRVRLRPDDVIVMGSDGVMELGDGLMIDRIARISANLPPQQLAEKLVREAAVRRSRGRTDDMTCICVRIGDARQKNTPSAAAEG